jgi:hypothetical protein
MSGGAEPAGKAVVARGHSTAKICNILEFPTASQISIPKHTKDIQNRWFGI